MRGPSPAFVACCRTRRGRLRRWRGSPGPWSQPLAHPHRSALRLRQPSAMRPAGPEGVQQGWGAAAEGHGGPRSRQLQGVPHGQGPVRPVGLAPIHPVPIEGRLRADEPQLDGVHNPVHRRE